MEDPVLASVSVPKGPKRNQQNTRGSLSHASNLHSLAHNVNFNERKAGFLCMYAAPLSHTTSHMFFGPVE